VPALCGPGFAQSLWHPSQAAALLGIAAPAGDEPVRMGWDVSAVLTAWIECVEALPWEVLNAPTQSRGRTLRDLSVNVFRPIELLAEAWSSGRFFWDVPADDARVAALSDPGLLLDYLRPIQEMWEGFVGTTGDDLAEPKAVATSKGDLTYRELLDAQRLHAAYHLRQLVAFLEADGRQPATRFRPEHVAGLRLPERIF
jgi:hypothetical protein